MIACLGWGSLVWQPGKLPVTLPWRPDGPRLPVEFLRQSDRNRITLVLCDGVEPVPGLWAPMGCEDLDEAVDALRQREGPTPARNIGRWSTGSAAPPLIPELPAWAAERQVTDVVWTALGPKFDDQDGRRPTADDVIGYLRGLGEKGAEAQNYVRRAPPQIDTAFRRRIVAELGWSHQSR